MFIVGCEKAMAVMSSPLMWSRRDDATYLEKRIDSLPTPSAALTLALAFVYILCTFVIFVVKYIS